MAQIMVQIICAQCLIKTLASDATAAAAEDTSIDAAGDAIYAIYTP